MATTTTEETEDVDGTIHSGEAQLKPAEPSMSLLYIESIGENL